MLLHTAIFNFNKMLCNHSWCMVIIAFSNTTYPVAFDANAELRDNLALTSMMQYSSDLGCRAYWMLHSPMMPRWRTTLMAVSRSMWYSWLDKVWLGATTIESPGGLEGGGEKEMVNWNMVSFPIGILIVPIIIDIYESHFLVSTPISNIVLNPCQFPDLTY